MIDDQGIIKQLAILSSRETASYLQKIIAAKFPEQVVGQSIQNILQVDAISGATLSSSAILRGANLAAEPVRQELMNLSLVDSRSPWSYFGLDGSGRPAGICCRLADQQNPSPTA